MTENTPERTPAEREILEWMTEQRGREYVEEQAELILTQAELIGELKREDRS